MPDRVYGPFVQVSPGTNGPPIITRLEAPPGQPNARNQLVLAPGVGGGPIVRVIDFVANGNQLAINASIMFNAFADDPALVNSRTGLNVAIGDVIDRPNPLPDGTIMPNSQGAQLGSGDVTFPFSTNYYRQGTAEIIVSQASGGRKVRVFADYNPVNFFTGQPSVRTSITQLDLRPVLLRSATVFDPNNPLNGYQSVVDFNDLPNAIDNQFVGTTLTAVSYLGFSVTGTTASGIVGSNVWAAGATAPGLTNRGPRVRIFGNLGPNAQFILTDGVNPDALPVRANSPIFPGGNTPYFDPIDNFLAFTGPAGQFGVSSVSFGFGVLPTATVINIELPPLDVQTVNNAILI